ncbi:MAG: exo-alpha-sialidase [Methanobacteriota archaeon]|nr:MAG: exo-alpha-sialidase [Euryarchaeota archaeon]
MHRQPSPRIPSAILMVFVIAFSILPHPVQRSSNVDHMNLGPQPPHRPLINESLPANGWSQDIRLTEDSGYSIYPDIASNGRSVHVVWEHYGNETGEWKYYLMYKRSRDSGLTWDDGLGNVGAVRQLVDLGDLPPLVSARIGANGSNVHLAYLGRHGNFWWPSYLNSTDNGMTWSAARMIGNKSDSCPGALDLAVMGNNIHIAWLYGINPLDMQVHYSMSSDGGTSWSSASKMSSLPEGSQRPSIAVEGNNVHLAYLGGNYHGMYYKRSLDNGRNWDDGLGNTGVQRLLLMDMENRSIVSQIAVSEGRVHLVWNREIPHSVWNESEGLWRYIPYYQMLFVNSEDNGGNWSGEKVLVDHTDLPFNIWGDKPYGHTVAMWDMDANGQEVHVFSCDTRDDKSTCEIYYKRSDDGGRNWSGDIRLTNAPNGSFNPRAALNDGQVHVVWSDRRDDNNPHIDTEEEIYYKRYPSLGPQPPENLSADLNGTSYENVNISWQGLVSSGDQTVHRYYIFHSETFRLNRSGYALLDSVQASNESYYSYIHERAGEGDSKNHFYYVCAVNSTNCSSCSNNQVGKFTRPLSKGPNLISIPLIQSNESIERALQTVKFDKAWTYDTSSSRWIWYMSSKPYKGRLNSITNTMGVWMNVVEASNLTIAGIVPDYTVITLHKGWNLVGYPSFNENYTVADLEMAVTVERVEGFNSSGPPFFLKLMVGTDPLVTGYGYWIRVGSETLWTPSSA